MTEGEGTVLCLLVLGILVALHVLLCRIEKLESWRRREERKP